MKTRNPRRETTRMRPETTSREAKIQMLVGAGFGNAAIWSALEEENPSIIHDNKRRLSIAKVAYDAELRGKFSRAINSTRALAIKDDQRIMGIVDAVGGNEIESKTLDELTLSNLHRFSWGMPALDYVYGSTEFVHLTDSPDSKYAVKSVKFTRRDEFGKAETIEHRRKTWVSGKWKAGDPLLQLNGEFLPTRDKDGNLIDIDQKLVLTEHGCPESFISIWGGEPGVGKSKLAIAAGKAINKSTNEAILYVNGEDSEEKFRMKVGQDANSDLFNVVNAKMMPIERACQMARAIRPRVVFFDSVQTLAEWDKGNRGQRSVMLILQSLMNDIGAGKPHIVLISQLNKQNELKGSRDLEHLADMVAAVTKIDGRKGQFMFECPRKNRGGEAPRGAIFKHLKNGVECISDSNVRTVPFKLVQAGQTGPATNEGITDPEAMPMGEDDGETGTELT